MTKPKLQKLVDLAEQFSAAVYGAALYESHPNVVLVVPKADAAAVQNLTARNSELKRVFNEKKISHAPAKELNGLVKDGMKTYIQMLDVLAGVTLSELGEAKASSDISDSDRTSAISNGFAKADAPALAKLFAPKK
jgi:hypothetical protein